MKKLNTKQTKLKQAFEKLYHKPKITRDDCWSFVDSLEATYKTAHPAFKFLNSLEEVGTDYSKIGSVAAGDEFEMTLRNLAFTSKHGDKVIIENDLASGGTFRDDGWYLEINGAWK